MTSDLPPTGDQESPPQPPPPPATGPGSPPRHQLDDFFDRIRALNVVRPDEGRWGPGVAAGLSRRWNIDVILIRGGFVALSIFGGLGLVAYGLAWMLLPQQDGRIHLQQAIRGDFSAGFVGAALVCLAAIGGSGGPGLWHHGLWFSWGFPAGLVLGVGLIVVLWWSAGHGWVSTGLSSSAGSRTADATGPGSPAAGFSARPGSPASTGSYAAPAYGGSSTGTPVYGSPAYGTAAPAGWTAAPAPSRSPRALSRERSTPSPRIVRLTLGIAVLVAAVTLIVGRHHDWSTPTGVVAAALALVVIASGVIASGLTGRRAPGLISLGIILALGSLAGAGAHNVGVHSGQNVSVVGSRDWHPSTADRSGTEFNLGVGEASLWLTDPAILTNATLAKPLRVAARVGAGHLTVIVPDGVATRLEIQLGAGEITDPNGTTTQVEGKRNRGAQVENLSTGPSTRPRLIVEIQQGVGRLEIKTASQSLGPATATPASPTPTATGSSPAPTSAPTPTATKK